MEVLSCDIKKNLGKRNPSKKIPDISGNGNPKKASFFPGNATSPSPPILKKTHPKKVPYISGNETF